MGLRKNILAGLVLILILVHFTGCNNKAKDIKNKPQTTTTQNEQGKIRTLEKTIANIEPERKRTFVDVEFEGGNIKFIGDIIYAEEDRDIELVVNIGWGLEPIPPKPVNFHLLIFIDYEQIEFTVGESLEKIKKYKMQMMSGGGDMGYKDGYKIPVKIPVSDLKGMHKLMIVYEYAEEVNERLTTGQGATFDLIVGERTNFKLPSEIAEAETILSPNPWESWIQVDQRFNPEYIENETLGIYPQIIRTSPGELVPLAFRFSGEGENGILFFTVHGEQTELEGSRFLYYEDQKDLKFMKTYIKAPDEKGEYVLCGYYISNPYILTMPSSRPRITSTRKVVLVVE